MGSEGVVTGEHRSDFARYQRVLPRIVPLNNNTVTMNHLVHPTVAASLRSQHLVSGCDVEIANQLSALASAQHSQA